MGLRAGHGRGKGSPRIEVKPADEQPPAQAVGADPLVTGRDERKRVRTTDAARAMAKLPRRTRFVPRKFACDPRFEPHNRNRLAWQRSRIAELSAAHGGVSRGVGAIVSSAAWLYAAGEFAAELAAESGDVDMFKSAASLTSTARQHELASWELAAREGQARKQAQQNNPQSPLIGALGDGPGVGGPEPARSSERRLFAPPPRTRRSGEET
jgi:hypothetical protein